LLKYPFRVSTRQNTLTTILERRELLKVHNFLKASRIATLVKRWTAGWTAGFIGWFGYCIKPTDISLGEAGRILLTPSNHLVVTGQRMWSSIS
jgi:hypothetical protein